MHTSYCWLFHFKYQLNLRSVERLVVLDGIAVVMERRGVVARVQRRGRECREQSQRQCAREGEGKDSLLDLHKGVPSFCIFEYKETAEPDRV